MIKKRVFAILAVFVILFSSCREKNRFSQVDLSGVQSPVVKFERFDKDLISIDTSDVKKSVSELRAKYGNIIDLYSTMVLNIGNIDSVSSQGYLKEFLASEAYRTFFDDCDSVFSNGFDAEEKELASAFKYAKYYFPEKNIPERFVAIMSAFGSKVYYDAGSPIFIVSLEHYLGSDYSKYKYVDGVYDYLAVNYRRSKIVTDVLYAWLLTEFPFEKESPKLLDEMVYQGKMMYLLKSFLPMGKDVDIFGFTKDQLDWCRANEGAMWNSIATSQHLYSMDKLTISKYVADAPKTAFFPDGSPGRSGVWIGYRIVNEYMERNPELTLPQLIENNNSQEILAKSKYKP